MSRDSNTDVVTLYWMDRYRTLHSARFRETEKHYVALPDDAHPFLFRTHFPKAADNDAGHAAGVKGCDALWFSEQAAIEAEIEIIEASIDRLRSEIDQENRFLKKSEDLLLEIRKRKSKT